MAGRFDFWEGGLRCSGSGISSTAARWAYFQHLGQISTVCLLLHRYKICRLNAAAKVPARLRTLMAFLLAAGDLRMRRIVLVDRASNRVCGDTSAPGPYAQLWTEIAAHLEDDIAVLAASAARLLDQSQGETAQDYIFTPFVSATDLDGYLIFDCTCDGGQTPFMDIDPPNPDETIRSVMTRCIYAGYVRRKH